MLCSAIIRLFEAPLLCLPLAHWLLHTVLDNRVLAVPVRERSGQAAVVVAVLRCTVGLMLHTVVPKLFLSVLSIADGVAPVMRLVRSDWLSSLPAWPSSWLHAAPAYNQLAVLIHQQKLGIKVV